MARPSSLCVHRDGKTTALRTATRSHRDYVNLMSFVRDMLSGPKTDAEDKGAALNILSVLPRLQLCPRRRYGVVVVPRGWPSRPG